MIDDFSLDKLPSINLLNRDKLPQRAGIYFAVDDKKRLLYVGKAQNLYKRWLNHHRFAQLEKINKKNTIMLKWYECENKEEILTSLENYFIETYFPELNQTKVELKRIIPAEITLRETLVKISKYVIICGYEENSIIFGLPTVFLKYDSLSYNPARILRRIFNADSKKGYLKWSYYSRRQTTPIWQTKCNGIAIVIGCDMNINYYIQHGQITTLAGISLLSLAEENYQQCILERDWSQSYHPNIEAYDKDPISLLWSKNLTFNQLDAKTIKKFNQKRTESKIGKGRVRGKQIEVYCEAIGRGKFAIKAYQEAIDWFGGCEILGLEKADYTSSKINSAPKWFKSHKITVRILEESSYRSLSAPISAANHAELEQRLEQIRQISPWHQKIKFKP
ncbi:MAG: GIY-YIG nuclease family protein [Pleurocapsa minor HA4230-MV1]|jgi:predicted GIY-YIG superfamily endonuclease|nr:GIY-YIG nuclease family protein [Pleurocapsa minor HA4230-MV1]